jgi:hypothetical protein
MPAGFTADGLPVGAELLGRPFADARLVALAFAFEQARRHRRPPDATPPLGQARTPTPIAWNVLVGDAGPRARVRLTYHPGRSMLEYAVSVSGASADRIFAVTLDRGDESRGVVLRLSGPGESDATGTKSLTSGERSDLLAGRLFVALYTSDQPFGARAAIPIPGPR